MIIIISFIIISFPNGMPTVRRLKHIVSQGPVDHNICLGVRVVNPAVLYIKIVPLL